MKWQTREERQYKMREAYWFIKKTNILADKWTITDYISSSDDKRDEMLTPILVILSTLSHDFDIMKKSSYLTEKKVIMRTSQKSLN